MTSETDTPETDAARYKRERDEARMLAGELIAVIRINTMRGTWAEATTEQIDEFLKPWIARLNKA